MGADPPEVRPRYQRLLAYLRHNRVRIAVDLAVVTAWVLVTWSTFAWFSLPTWLLYVTLFAGVIIYSRITPPWERPYRSPDLVE